MRDTRYEILVWLPWPMGDAILCTPALRAIREHSKDCYITFFANSAVREVLSPSELNDGWIEQQGKNPFVIAKVLKRRKFTHAILFKNSFSSALAVFLARIPLRIGYSRECRGFLLTDRLYPPRLPDGRYKPISMIDYYLAIASWLGCDTTNRKLELLTDPVDEENLRAKLPAVVGSSSPIVVIVPGGAFGPSKYWPGIRFAQVADWLISNYNATVVISVSPEDAEKRIAKEICDSSKCKLINLGDRSVSLGELKALFSKAALVISNDTGPRHIAIAMRRKVVTLFGPNNPAWTDTGYKDEIQLIGDAPCAPCDKSICKRQEHLCMQAITVEMVCAAAKKLLKSEHEKTASKSNQNFIEVSKSFFVDADYKSGLSELGLTSIDAVFSFKGGENLTKENLARFKSRVRFKINSPAATLFLKRYDSPPILLQLKNRLLHRKQISCGLLDFEMANKLAEEGINTPKTICYGEQWGRFFEKRSFIITEKIRNAESLEQKLPDYFNGLATAENLRLRRNFIAKLAIFVKKFHGTNYRHRDLYFSHIFCSNSSEFYLIDLARVFKPRSFFERFRIKDIAQIYYSAPGRYFSRTDRLRFYLALVGQSRLTEKDKVFIRKLVNKAKRMARHDIKHARQVPFAN